MNEPCRAPKREIVDAILNLPRAGCSWRLVPHDFLPSQTVWCDLCRWEREGVRARVHHTLFTATGSAPGAGAVTTRDDDDSIHGSRRVADGRTRGRISARAGRPERSVGCAPEVTACPAAISAQDRFPDFRPLPGA